MAVCIEVEQFHWNCSINDFGDRVGSETPHEFATQCVDNRQDQVSAIAEWHAPDRSDIICRNS
jgi:hypothetical protein